MKNLFTTLAACAAMLCSGCQSDPNLYKDPSQPIEKRVENLLQQMTLEEKLEQLNLMVLGQGDNVNNMEDRDGHIITPMTGAFIYFGKDVESANALQRRAVEQSRLGIPVLLGHDVIHGYRTLFPMPLAQACSWNPELSYRASRVAAAESYMSGLRWTFSPMLDVARDSRWGRVAESYGEDPYTNARFAAAVVRGYQGDKLSDKYSIAACPKHFAGYAYSQGGRDYNPTELSDLALWETVLPPYQAAVESGAMTVMSSFNDLNGVPTVANKELLTDILRGRVGFDGFVVSDWRSVEQLPEQRFVADSLEAAVVALEAGNDMDMYDDLYRTRLPEALASGRTQMSYIDEAVRRVLKVKFALGLFENPYTEVVDVSKRYLQAESVALAKEMAEESMVLLKNEGQILPLVNSKALSKSPKQILLVGPMVKDRINMMGTWRAKAEEADAETIYDAMQSEFNPLGVTIDFVDGAGFTENAPHLLSNFARKAAKADVIVIALGERYSWSGENGSKASLRYPDSQEAIVEAAKSFGRPIILLTSSGRAVELTALEQDVDAIVQMWQPGLYGGSAISGILSGSVNPSGRLAITFPYSTGQIPIYYNHRPNARGAWTSRQGDYIDAPTEPLYTFGEGLSYSTFSHGAMELSSTRVKADGKITATVRVTNESARDGMETLLWYVDDVAASITQPVKKLKHFEKSLIKGGESHLFSFEIDPMRDLSFVDSKGHKVVEKGDFYIIAGDQRMKITLE